MASERDIPMRIDNSKLERVSPWMRKYTRDDAAMFAKFPRNDGRFYFGSFILTLLLTVGLSVGFLNMSESGGRAGLFLVILPFAALYALTMYFWHRFGRIEISLGDRITKKIILGRICFGWERWLWPEVHGVWAQKMIDDIPDHSEEYKSTVYLKHNQDRQELLGNLTFEEAESLREAIADRLKRRRTV